MPTSAIAGLSRDHIADGNSESGLGGYLSGKTEAASACYATSLPNLYVLSSGPMRSDAAELAGRHPFPVACWRTPSVGSTVW